MVMNKAEPRRTSGVGAFEMMRDVLVASINKGQLPVALLGFIIVVVILKMPGGEVAKLVLRLVDVSERKWVIGYVVAIALALCWYFHARYQRRYFTGEMNRLSRERTALQEKMLGEHVKSSEGR